MGTPADIASNKTDNFPQSSWDAPAEPWYSRSDQPSATRLGEVDPQSDHRMMARTGKVDRPDNQLMMRRIGEAVDEVEVDDDGWTVALDINKLANRSYKPWGASTAVSRDQRYNSIEQRTEELRARFIKDKIKRFRDKLELEKRV